MNYKTFLRVCITLLAGLALNASQAQTDNIPKKKIMIVWCKGGGAHQSMKSALEFSLSDVYDVVSVNPFDSVWTTNDILKEGLNKVLSESSNIFDVTPPPGELIYNYLSDPSFINSAAMTIEALLWLSKNLEKAPILYTYSDYLINGGRLLRSIIEEVKTRGVEECYNRLLQDGKINVVNAFAALTDKEVAAHLGLITDRFAAVFKQEKPDIIISVMPGFNNAINEAAYSLQIPFLLIAPDFDINNYFLGMRARSWKHFFYTLPYNDSLLIEIADKMDLPKPVSFGIPLRSDFYENKDKDNLKKSLKIPTDKPVIMIMMGGAGSPKSRLFVESLLEQSDSPLHIIVCVGNNETLRRELKYNIVLPEQISLTVQGYTSDVSDIMAISDILITKPGPVSLCEAFHMGLPVIVDATTEPLTWEKSHIEFVERHELGAVLTDAKALPNVIKNMLKQNRYSEIKSKLKLFALNDFDQQLKLLLSNIIRVSEEKKYELTDPFF